MRWPSTAVCGALALGCSTLTGLSDLEKVDCVKNCPGADGGSPAPELVSVGRKTSCVVFSDGLLWCWGANPGVEPGAPVTKPVQVTGISDLGVVTIGLNHVCALDGAGRLWCWGSNEFGQLGDGSTTPSAVPKLVPNLPALSSVSASVSHTCAYTDPNAPPVQIFCWGSNSHSQLGDGTTDSSPSPRKVVIPDGAPLLRLGTGDAYTCAVVDVAGVLEMRCWGRNDKGQCGLDPVANPVVTVPTAVPGLPPVERVYSGSDHMCTRTTGTKQVWCWGSNSNGQIGINTTSEYEPATAAVGFGSQTIDTMGVGYRHTCMLTEDAMLGVCWGANNLGQFSGEAGTDEPAPILVPALDGTPFSNRQAEHICRLSGTTVSCWGANDSGQIGNGKIEPLSPPFDVSFGP